MPIASKDLLLNEKIRAPKMRVVGPDGEQLGIMDKNAALDLAYDRGLDLVEIAPGATPPVCRIMDYGKFRYEKEKKQRESRKKQVVVELKEIKFSCNIGIHDFNTKINHGNRFLKEGNKVKVTIKFSGREMTQTDNGYVLMDKIAAALEEVGTVEKKPSLDGRFMTMFLGPKKETPVKTKEKAEPKED
ncbi:MAG: translation initiation factor IF-3 [Clostridia bacterium]|nr:translation initiation factor IF-3 [Clostridia bacterium]